VPPGPLQATTYAPGWYQDPWAVAPWRWFDGRAWTGHVHGAVAAAPERKPRLPAWLSPPVLSAAVVAVPAFGYLTFTAPMAVALGLVPLLIVLPVLVWLDRVEPEPWPARLHALLWGATVAAVVAAIVNTIVAAVTNETIAAVVSAPLVEEGMKALGIVWAVRRKELDGVMDGITYAGWVALGFAVVEDFFYFAVSDSQDVLLFTFVARALFTPFAHPFFSAWIGLSIGLAVQRQKPIGSYLWWGLGLAVASHAAWNGSLTVSEQYGQDGGALVLLGAALCFFLIFVGGSIALIRTRKGEQRRYAEQVPVLVSVYGLTAQEVERYGTWRQARQVRRTLERSERGAFDRTHAALARLALLHRRDGSINLADQARLRAQLDESRSK
jgi:RsiW-degrading membrane proteinase PrsW (M82 family)